MAQYAQRHWWGLLIVIGLSVPFLVQCVATAVPVSHPTGAVALCKHGCAPASRQAPASVALPPSNLLLPSQRPQLRVVHEETQHALPLVARAGPLTRAPPHEARHHFVHS